MKRTEQVNAPLWKLDQRVVGIRVSTSGRKMLIKGTASYERDPELGPILRVCLSRQNNSEVFLAEREWQGKIIAGKGKDHDFVIALK